MASVKRARERAMRVSVTRRRNVKQKCEQNPLATIDYTHGKSACETHVYMGLVLLDVMDM